MTPPDKPLAALPPRDVYLNVDMAHEHIQLSIDCNGIGYRLAGPKYDGTSKRLLRHKLDRRDVEEIRRYLRQVRP